MIQSGFRELIYIFTCMERRRATKDRIVNFDSEPDEENDFKPKMIDCYENVG